MKNRRKRSLWIPLAVALLPVLAFGIWVGRQIRQQHLDHALIQAIKRRDTPTAIALLNQGADANAMDKPYRPTTLKSLLTDCWNRSKGHKPPQDTKDYPPALLLVYGAVSFNLPDTSIELMLNMDEGRSSNLSLMNKAAPAPLISALLEHGAALHTKERVGETLLTYACICADAKSVKILLNHHVDANAEGDVGFPLLMCTEDYDCARLLLEVGANANARDSSGRTRLMYIQNTKLYPLLLKYGANTNAQDKEGRTALIHLFVSPYLDDNHIRIGMRFLIHHGAKVSLKDKAGKTAMGYAKAGKANWMAMGFAKDGYDKATIRLLEEALKREWAQKNRRK